MLRLLIGLALMICTHPPEAVVDAACEAIKWSVYNNANNRTQFGAAGGIEGM